MDRRKFLSSLISTEKGKFEAKPASNTSLAPWQPTKDNPWDISAVNHIYHRLGFGCSYDEVQAALQLTPSELINSLMDEHLVTDGMPSPPPGWEEWLIVPPYLGPDHDPHQHEEDGYYTAKQDIRVQWTMMMTEPKIQLREKLTLFWHNHFVIEEDFIYHPQPFFRYLEYLRKHSWGYFKQMVKDITINPSMLVYLSAIWSSIDQLNENYGRELMELFTMGRTDRYGKENYSQEDVRSVALALAGWRFKFEEPAPNVLPPYFANYYFDFDTKTTPFGAPPKVYGLDTAKKYALFEVSLDKIEADIIELIFEKKAAQIAWHISKKIYRNFVYDNAESAEAENVIEQLAKILLDNNWELKPALQTLFQSEHFFDLNFRGSAIKSPYEYMCGIFRALNIGITPYMTGSLWEYGVDINQWLGNPPNVKGWPGYRTWLNSSTLPKRNNTFARALIVNGELPGQLINPHNGFFYDSIPFTDSGITAWAQQYPDYSGDLTQFAKQIAEHLCAIMPNESTVQHIVSSSGIVHTYEWASLSDSEKILPLRKMLFTVVDLPHFQIC